MFIADDDDAVSESRLPAHIRTAWAAHKAEAKAALALVQDLAPNLPRVPGCDTVLRLAVRLASGRTVEEAAAREYLYRWRLSLDALEASGRRRSGRKNPFAAHYAPHGLGL